METFSAFTGPLCGEFYGHWWIPLTKANNAELWRFLWSAPKHTAEQTIETLVIETPSCSLWHHCNAFGSLSLASSSAGRNSFCEKWTAARSCEQTILWYEDHITPVTSLETRAPFQYPIRRLIVRSRKVSKPRDSYLELSDRSEIWQTLRQHCCRLACQISKWCDNLNYNRRASILHEILR